MQSFCGRVRLVRRHATNSSKIVDFNSVKGFPLIKPNSLARIEVGDVKFLVIHLIVQMGCSTDRCASSLSSHHWHWDPKPGPFHQSMALQTLSGRCITTVTNSADSIAQDASASVSEVPPRIKFKRLDKTAKHIMQIIDKEAVEEVRKQKELPDIKPGYIIQLKVEVPNNKRRASILKGIVIARRNAGLNTAFRLRRLVAGVGVESLFPLYSPNIKEIKVLDKKRVRRAKLYYLRDRMNPLKK